MRCVRGLIVAACLMVGLAPVAQAGWLLFESPEYGFAALFPKTPKREEQSGVELAFTSFTARNDAAVCFVAVAMYRRIVETAEMDVIRDGFVKGMGAKVSASKRKTFLRGEEQLEALAFEAASDDRSFRSLIVVDGQTVYQVAGGVSKIDGDDAELDACVGGFRLLPKA